MKKQQPDCYPMKAIKKQYINVHFIPPSYLCTPPCLSGDADAVFLHVHDGLRHFHRDGVSCELHVERPLQLL